MEACKLALGVCDTALYDLMVECQGRDVEGNAESQLGGRESRVWAGKATKSLRNLRLMAERGGEGSECVTDR